MTGGHSQRAHALLSASGAERWLNCTPSARLEDERPNTSGKAAEEGTLAHELAELLLKKELKLVTSQEFELALGWIVGNDLYDAAMQDHCENYVVFVMEKFAEAKTRSKDAQIFLEKKVDLAFLIPEGKGIIDTPIVSDGLLDVIDLKYGKGVAVTADENKQLKLYALGLLEEWDIMYDLHTIRLTIYQPRLDSVSSFEIKAAELKAWGEEYVRPRAVLAFKGEGEFSPGKHCQFCRVRAECRANAEFNLQIAKHDFKNPDLLEPEDIADILTREKMFQSWLTSVTEFALDQAVNHSVKWPGFKLVEGRSNRKYADEEKVVVALVKAGFDSSNLYKPLEVLGITAMEKVVGKKQFDVLLSPLIVKPPGKPSLVPASDKRPELNSLEMAKADFAEEVD